MMEAGPGTRRSRAGWSSATAAGVLALFLGGCGGGGDQTFADGYYRFVHVALATDTVSIAADGKTIVSTLKYHAATPYIQLGWGLPKITVQSANSGATYADAQVPVAGAAHYSYFLYGGGSSPTILSLRDDTSDADSGKFNLRSINLATGSGSLDIYLLDIGATADANAATISYLASGTSSAFAQYTTGNYHIVVTPAGSKEVIYDSGEQALSGNSKVTLVVFATGSGKLVNAALMREDGGGTTNFVDNSLARFKFVGAAADVQPLDLLIDGSVTLANVPYGGLSAYARVAAGSRNFKIQASNAPGSYVTDQNQTMNPAYDHSLVTYSIPGTGAVSMFTLQDNNLPPASDKLKLRIVNAGSDGTAYDVYSNFTKLVTNIAQGTGSSYLDLDGAIYTLTFSPAGTTNQAATIIATLEAGRVYTIYTYGRSGSVAAVLTTDY
jgi:hypothetical protein